MSDDGTETAPAAPAVGSARDVEDADVVDVLRLLARAPDASVPAVDVSGRGGLHLPAEPVPTTIGGFEIVRTLGAGGMGVVFEAIDPTLRRRVALKLLRSRRTGPEGTARMLREAQALARLSHPNVVTAYGAGIEGDRVYLAMELVTGVTARQWCTDGTRTLPAILAVYRQAAMGLAAAHDAGLVHRDVKPDNILVGDDGRVRITDFGLVGEAESSPPIVSDEAVDASLSLTATGTVLGTLPYIAPEAHRGEPIRARADQWSLCVALWEAIAGTRPHEGSTQRALVDAVLAGKLVPRPAGMSPAIRAVLARGLATDPAARWPSLVALFDALERARRGPRRRALGISLAAVALAAGGFALRSARQSEPAPSGGPLELGAAAPPPASRVLATPGYACPYMPSFVDDETLVFGDNDHHLLAMPATGGEPRRLPLTLDPYRVARGRRPGEAVFVSMEGDASQAAFVDVATGREERQNVHSSSYAAGGDALFYLRTEVPEIRRVYRGADEPAVTLPGGRWPYTVATTPRGDRLAITTAYDRSLSMVCLAELDPVTRVSPTPATCLEDRTDIVLGRAAFSPDGGTVYYQTTAGIRRRRGAEDVLWLPGAWAQGGIDVSPDGRALVYSDSRPAKAYVTPVGGSAAVLEGEYGYIAALPGGRWLYTRTLAKDDDLVVREADGSTRVVIPSGLGRIVSMVPDPGGQRVVFDLDNGDASGIYVVDLAPWPPIRITTSASDSSPVWTRDGKIAFTRWDMHNQPSVVIVDPAEGVRGDGTRVPVHPLPRVTAGLVPTTGELVLLSLDAKALFLWDPVTQAERSLDVSGIGKLLWLAAASNDGTQIAVLVSDVSVWSIPIPTGPTDHLAPRKVADRVPCGTGGMPVFDEHDQLYAVTRPWAGAIHRVELE